MDLNNIENFSWKLNRDMSHNDYESILTLLQKHPVMNVLEIGTKQGSSTALFSTYLKENYQEGKVYTVDNYSSDCQGNIGDCSSIKNLFFEQMTSLGLLDNTELLYMSSEEASKKFPDNFFDFIFIDGSHLYSDVKKDIENLYPKLKSDRIICGHDCELKANKFMMDTIRGNFGIKDFNIKKNGTWDTNDMIIFHLGVIIAVFEVFPNAEIQGDRIWWIQKENE